MSTSSQSSSPSTGSGRLVGLRRILTQLLAGMPVLPPTSKAVIAGQSWTAPQLTKHLNDCLAPFAAADVARAALHQAILSREGQAVEADKFTVGLIHFLVGYFGADNPILSRFNLEKKPRKRPSPDTQLAANIHRNATRKVRHIMGPKQRQAITVEAKPTVVLLGADGKPIGPTPTPAPEATPAAEATPASAPSDPSKTSKP